jgi:hypothetical protein
MDVFHLDSSSISSTMIDPEASIVEEITEVKFEAHSEFDLNFFDTPDDSMTQAAFSNPNSVESSPTPEPLLPLTPTSAPPSITSSNATINQKQQQQHQNMPQPAMVKHGKARDRLLKFFCNFFATQERVERETTTITSLCCAKLHHDCSAAFGFAARSGFWFFGRSFGCARRS